MVDIDDFEQEVECIYKGENTLSEITELFFGILVMGNALVNMTIIGLLENPMIHMGIWKSHLFVSI